MDKTKGKKKKIQQEPKLSFGSALKQNVRNYYSIYFKKIVKSKYNNKPQT